MDHNNKALNYFGSGFNCSQSVFAAFSDITGISEEYALKIGTSFGGGARCGQICGAVSGALMVLGMIYGYCSAEEKEKKARAYELTVDFNKRFCERNKSIVCSELLGYNLSDPGQMKIIRDNSLFTTVCPKMISDAVDILDEMIREYK